MTWQFTIVDVYTERPLAGNQLAVFHDAQLIPEPLLLLLAREVGFAETVFLYPPSLDGDARVRIFSPSAELPYAGHPLVGAAAVLGDESGKTEVRLETAAGTIPIQLLRDRGHTVAVLRRPVPTVSPWRNPEPLLAALGLTASTLPIELYDAGLQMVYVGVESRDVLREMHPDFWALGKVMQERGITNVGVNVFAGHDEGWKLRMFFVTRNVVEDPGSGSAVGPLAVHLVRHGKAETGVELDIRQGAEIGRPSVLHATVFGQPDRIERVEVAGGTQIVGRGEFFESVLSTLLEPGSPVLRP